MSRGPRGAITTQANHDEVRILASSLKLWSSALYAIVKTGGKQYKVAVDDVLTVEKINGKPGATLTFPALLLVDGDTVTTDADALAAVSVTATVVEHTKGPKIRIHKFKNKTGYHKRQGHRQPLTKVQVNSIAQTTAE